MTTSFREHGKQGKIGIHKIHNEMADSGKRNQFMIMTMVGGCGVKNVSAVYLSAMHGQGQVQPTPAA